MVNIRYLNPFKLQIKVVNQAEIGSFSKLNLSKYLMKGTTTRNMVESQFRAV